MAEVTSPTSWINYANQGATRSLPLSDQLTSALDFLPDLGVTMEVFSGGQPSAGKGPRVGSTRHDHGNAADVFFYKDGEKLDWSNPEHVPIFQQIVQQGKANGITGFGAGDGYMRPGSMHLGFGTPAVWGAGGKGDKAPDWLRMAYAGEVPVNPAVNAIGAATTRRPGSGMMNDIGIMPKAFELTQGNEWWKTAAANAAKSIPTGRPPSVGPVPVNPPKGGGLFGGLFGNIVNNVQGAVRGVQSNINPVAMMASSLPLRTAVIDPHIQRIFNGPQRANEGSGGYNRNTGTFGLNLDTRWNGFSGSGSSGGAHGGSSDNHPTRYNEKGQMLR